MKLYNAQPFNQKNPDEKKPQIFCHPVTNLANEDGNIVLHKRVGVHTRLVDVFIQQLPGHVELAQMGGLQLFKDGESKLCAHHKVLVAF